MAFLVSEDISGPNIYINIYIKLSLPAECFQSPRHLTEALAAEPHSEKWENLI